MFILKKVSNILLIFSLFTIIIPKPALAYLDPGSGSYLIQIIIASTAGGGILLKTKWKNIKNTLIKKNKSEKEKENEK